MFFYQVALNININESFDYKSTETLLIGQIVLVNFRGSDELGVIIDNKESDLDISKIKNIKLSFDFVLSDKQLEFLKWVAKYTMNPIGQIAALSLPNIDIFIKVKKEKLFAFNPDFKLKRLTEIRANLIRFMKNQNEPLSINDMALRSKINKSVITSLIKQNVFYEADEVIVENVINHNFTNPDFSYLSDEQKAAFNTIKDVKEFKTFLINGVTGSGKTEVYFAKVNEILQTGKQVLIMLPEIALTSQFLKRMTNIFNIQPVLWHSNVSSKDKKIAWKNIFNGNAKIIVGTRSSLFLPYKNLGLIVIDEEHDSSYKQEDNVLYNGRDMAVLKAKIEDIPVILASATPSLESVINCESGNYTEIKLNNRFGKAVLPDISLIDMKENKNNKQKKSLWLSDTFISEIENVLNSKEQAMLFLNRRGYAPLVICQKCGHRIKCENCDTNMIMHSNKWGEKLLCHYCGKTKQIPLKCPCCEASASFVLCGPGIEKIQEEIKVLFPKARVKVISTDNISGANDLSNVISEIENKQVDIIIGTQILTKGHNFPDITFVGIIDGDMSLFGNDFRNGEKTFALIEQTGGRAGRGEKKGKVFIQTYNPDNIVMQAILQKDKELFFKEEKASRKLLSMPPYGRLASIIISSKDKDKLNNFAQEIAKKIPCIKDVKIYGPQKAELAFLNGRHRLRFLIQTNKNINIQKIISNWLNVKTPYNINLKIDIDPYNFM